MSYITAISPISRQRRNTLSHKWNSHEESDILPFSVADMDFRVSDAIQKSLAGIVEQGIYGYSFVPEEYYTAFIHWMDRQHDLLVPRDWLLCSSGVIPAIMAVINSVASPGDEIIIQEPVYHRFRQCIEHAGCKTIVNTLINMEGHYEIDFADLELKAARPQCKILLFCNPHNPVGRVWDNEELMQLCSICNKHNVLIISDESHCDLILGNGSHIPLNSRSINPLCRTTLCYSPGKTFNVSGLRQAMIVINDDVLREKTAQFLAKIHADDITAMAVAAQIAGYEHSENWLNGVLHYIYENIRLMQRYLSRYFSVYILPPEGTYLVWADISNTHYSGYSLSKKLESVARIRVTDGAVFGPSGRNYIRINMACHREILRTALRRLGECQWLTDKP